MAFFQRHGFVVVRAALAGGRLESAQAAWRRAEPPLRERWLSARAHGRGVSRHGFREMGDGAHVPHVARKFFGLPWDAPGNLHENFVDFIDLPSVVPLVERLVGDTEVNVYGQRRRGAARCTECSARCLPPDQDGAGCEILLRVSVGLLYCCFTLAESITGVRRYLLAPR